MERCRIRAGVVIGVVVLCALCLLIGFIMGAKTTIKVGLAIAQNFIEIEVDEEMVYDAIFRYKYEVMNFESYEILQNMST